ncbi:MAG: Holliday junction resolvase RuvX [Candidatus Dormibacteria bacterium]
MLGIDAGAVRVGLAASDPTRLIASPVATLARREGAGLWERLAAEIEARRPERIIVGLPRRLDGSSGRAAAAARELATEIGRRTGLPVEMWDEWLTSVEAERILIGGGMRRRHRRDTVDAVAASLMLQAWLDRQRVAPHGGGKQPRAHAARRADGHA